jgi:hypothetical protein
MNLPNFIPPLEWYSAEFAMRLDGFLVAKIVQALAFGMFCSARLAAQILARLGFEWLDLLEHPNPNKKADPMMEPAFQSYSILIDQSCLTTRKICWPLAVLTLTK